MTTETTTTAADLPISELPPAVELLPGLVLPSPGRQKMTVPARKRQANDIREFDGTRLTVVLDFTPPEVDPDIWADHVGQVTTGAWAQSALAYAAALRQFPLRADVLAIGERPAGALPEPPRPRPFTLSAAPVWFAEDGTFTQGQPQEPYALDNPKAILLEYWRYWVHPSELPLVWHAHTYVTGLAKRMQAQRDDQRRRAEHLAAVEARQVANLVGWDKPTIRERQLVVWLESQGFVRDPNRVP